MEDSIVGDSLACGPTTMEQGIAAKEVSETQAKNLRLHCQRHAQRTTSYYEGGMFVGSAPKASMTEEQIWFEGSTLSD